MKRKLIHIKVLLVIAVLSFLFHNCQSNKTILKPFDISATDSVLYSIKDSDNLLVTTKLNSNQIRQLVNQLNSSENDGFWKFMYKFTATFYFNDKTQRTIIGIGNHFKLKQEHGDWTFKVSDSTFFDRLIDH